MVAVAVAYNFRFMHKQQLSRDAHQLSRDAQQLSRDAQQLSRDAQQGRDIPGGGKSE